MKKLALGMLVAVAMTGSASAADMAVKARPVVAPVIVYNWSGCYIGGNVGGAWHRIEQSANTNSALVPFVPPLALGTGEDSNFVGGVQVGCDYQFAGKWVVGVQGMFDFGDVRSRNNVPDPRLAGFFTTTRTRDIYTGTARLGYLFTPQLLGYVKGGGAWTRSYTEFSGTIPAPFLSQFATADRSGWTVGGGLEYMFAPGWSVFGEFNYMDFGRKDILFTAAPGTIGLPSINQTRLTMATALVGVNYKFNFGGAPLVARY